ncbi:MAG TPA: preprotein translocase subunit SecG [Candidatus Binatia bacterium]|nr:preprotein translocase subunit SecG [Candidatus Binatia bacterium]
MVGVLLYYVVPIIHVLACLVLVVVVLLQQGKGADMGAVFGGGSQTFFGSGGAGNFLTKITATTAAIFMVTALVLTYGTSRTSTSRLLERIPATAPEAPPAAPESTPAPAPEAQGGGQPAAPAEQPPPGQAPAPPQ